VGRGTPLIWQPLFDSPIGALSLTSHVPSFADLGLRPNTSAVARCGVHTGCDISPLPCRVLSPGPSLAPSAPPPCNSPRVHFYTPSLDPIFLLFAEPSPPSNSSPFPLCHSRSSNPYCFYQRALLDLCVYMSRLVKQTERRTATCNAYPRDKVLGLATRRGYDIIAWDK